MYFELRGKLPKKIKMTIELVGLGTFLLVWFLITDVFELAPPKILPSPIKVIMSFGELHSQDGLVRNAFYSIWLNILGLLEAVALSIPLGIFIGLFPLPRSISERYITAVRFLPLTAVVGLFIAWFGIELNMKVQFLAFSIFLYLLAQVVVRVDEVEEVLDQTALTLGATKWQRIQKIFIPAVVSKVYDDIRILAALSWTYIVVAEMVNSNGGGIGALAYITGRQAKIDKVFALMLVIILIGFVQDKFFVTTDRWLFKFKYPNTAKVKQEVKNGGKCKNS